MKSLRNTNNSLKFMILSKYFLQNFFENNYNINTLTDKQPPGPQSQNDVLVNLTLPTAITHHS